MINKEELAGLLDGDEIERRDQTIERLREALKLADDDLNRAEASLERKHLNLVGQRLKHARLLIGAALNNGVDDE